MGRFGTDVVALACIAGGALAGAAVTAGVMVSNANSEVRVVTGHCAVVEAPRIVVRLQGEDGGPTVTTRSYTAQARVADGPTCVSSSSVSVIRTAEWTEELGAKLDAARAEVDEMRLHADELRLEAEKLRFEAVGMRVEADELHLSEQEAALEALNELLAEMKGSDASAEDLRAAMQSVRELAATRDAKPVVRMYRPQAPSAPEAPTASAAPAAPVPPAPAVPGSGGN